MNASSKTADAGHASGLTIGLTVIATLGGLLFGYDTAVISGAIESIDINFINPLNLPEIQADSLSGMTVASALLGCVVGGGVAGWLSDRFGRKPALIAAAALFLVCALGSAMPEMGLGAIGSMGPAALLPFNIYRIIGGLGVGIASVASPLYIAEIAPKDQRGKLVSFNQIAIVGGIVGVYFVNWAIARMGDATWLHTTGWRLMFASETVPALLFLGLLTFAPDTPRWLVMKGRYTAALGVLARLGERDPKATLGEIEDSLVQRDERLLAFGGKVLMVGILLSIFQQFVGINAVLYYAPVIFKNMGASTDSSLLQTVVVGVANVAFTLVATFTVDIWGRKPLLLCGAVVMAVAMLALGLLFAMQEQGIWALVAMVVYIAGFAFSWGPVVWILLAEMFPNAIKGKAMALAVASQWVANLVVSWSFKVLDGNAWLNGALHHGFAYLLYGAMSILAAWFVLRLVPETKGHSLESMEALWTGRLPPHHPTIVADEAGA